MIELTIVEVHKRIRIRAFFWLESLFRPALLVNRELRTSFVNRVARNVICKRHLNANRGIRMQIAYDTSQKSDSTLLKRNSASAITAALTLHTCIYACLITQNSRGCYESAWNITRINFLLML